MIWAIGIALVACTIFAVILFSYRFLPQAVSEHSSAIDHQLKITMIVIAVGFLISHFALAIVLWHKHKVKSGGGGSNPKLEIAIAAIITVIFVSVGIAGERLWSQLKLNEIPPDAVRIEVIAQQFAWYFRYPGQDGVFGRTSPNLIDESNNSPTARPGPLGIDPDDPYGKDDVVMATLIIPVNKSINLTLKSKDVIHNFYVPALRLKYDALPGSKVNLHFKALKEGKYEIACAELCGQLHHQMKAYLNVVSNRQFDTETQRYKGTERER